VARCGSNREAHRGCVKVSERVCTSDKSNTFLCMKIKYPANNVGRVTIMRMDARNVVMRVGKHAADTAESEEETSAHQQMRSTVREGCDVVCFGGRTTHTSGSNELRTPRAASTTRFDICGDTRVEYAIPRTRLMRPGSMSLSGVKHRTTEHRKNTCPPPSGGAPRREILSSSPSTPNFRRRGRATVRRASTDGSRSLFVTPSRVSAIGFFANGARQIMGSRKYPTALLVGHVWLTLPPMISPGRYVTVVPEKLMSMREPAKRNAVIRVCERK
jgi:hypothetical protein